MLCLGYVLLLLALWIDQLRIATYGIQQRIDYLAAISGIPSALPQPGPQLSDMANSLLDQAEALSMAGYLVLGLATVVSVICFIERIGGRFYPLLLLVLVGVALVLRSAVFV